MILEGVTVQECLTVYNELNMVAIINDGEFLGFREEEDQKSMLSNSGHDENNKYNGGVAGDQNGDEWELTGWYSRPWNYMLRYPNRTVANMIATLAKSAALMITSVTTKTSD